MFSVHKLAEQGKRTKLRDVLKKNCRVNVNTYNIDEMTPLYLACSNRKKGCVKELLKYNADPNQRCFKKRTPVHAAAIRGDIEIMSLLLSAGGDPTLLDEDGRSVIHLADFIDDNKTRQKFTDYIHKILNSYQTPIKEINSESKKHGSVLSCIDERELIHDDRGITFNNGAFMVYESMYYVNRPVTVKRLHQKTLEKNQHELIINEQNILSRLNFAKIISLLGISSFDSSNPLLVLERIKCGSLYSLLHEMKVDVAHQIDLVQILISICDALIYLHEKRIIHCYVNSHSILFVDFVNPKLGNFEYAVEKSNEPFLQKRSKVADNEYLNCAWNWLAPELMTEEPPSENTDMYSFCMVIWEVFYRVVPFNLMKPYEIKKKVLIEKLKLPLQNIPFPINTICKDGFQTSSFLRMKFEEVRNILEEYQYQRRTDIKSVSENSYNEGIVSLNELINSNDMGTMNSLDELDKCSQFTSSSVIHCDSYRAEFYLTKGGLLITKRADHGQEEKANKAKQSQKNKRAQSNNYQNKRNTFNNGKSQSSQNKEKPTDIHLDSAGTINLSPTNLKKESNEFEQTPPNNNEKPSIFSPPRAPRFSSKLEPTLVFNPKMEQISSPAPKQRHTHVNNEQQQQQQQTSFPSSYLTPIFSPASQTQLIVDELKRSAMARNNINNNNNNHNEPTNEKGNLSQSRPALPLTAHIDNKTSLNHSSSTTHLLSDIKKSFHLLNPQQQSQFYTALQKKILELTKERGRVEEVEMRHRREEEEEGEERSVADRFKTAPVLTPIESPIPPPPIASFQQTQNFSTPINLSKLFSPPLSKSEANQKVLAQENAKHKNVQIPNVRKLDGSDLSQISHDDIPIDQSAKQINRNQTNVSNAQNTPVNLNVNKNPKAQSIYSTVKKTTPRKTNLENVVQENENEISIELSEAAQRNAPSIQMNINQQNINYGERQSRSRLNVNRVNLPVGSEYEELAGGEEEETSYRSRTPTNHQQQQIKTRPPFNSHSNNNNNNNNNEKRSLRVKSNSVGPTSKIVESLPRSGSHHGSVKDLVNSFERNTHPTESESNLKHLREQRSKELNELVEKKKSSHSHLKDNLSMLERRGSEPMISGKTFFEQQQFISQQTPAQAKTLAAARDYPNLSTISEKTEKDSSLPAGGGNNQNNTYTTINSPLNPNLDSKTASTRMVRDRVFLDSSTALSNEGSSTRNNQSPHKANKPCVNRIVNQFEEISIRNQNAMVNAVIDSRGDHHHRFDSPSFKTMQQSGDLESARKLETRRDAEHENTTQQCKNFFSYSNLEEENKSTLKPSQRPALQTNNHFNNNDEMTHYSSQDDYLSQAHFDYSNEYSEGALNETFDSCLNNGKEKREENEAKTVRVHHHNQQQISAKTECSCPTPPPPPPPQRFRDTETKQQQQQRESKTNQDQDSNSDFSEANSYRVENKPIFPQIITKSSKHGNVKVDKQIIDTTNYEGYYITFETKSKEPNRYRIESSMVKKDTGESFLIAKTHVKTPKLTTKIVLDN